MRRISMRVASRSVSGSMPPTRRAPPSPKGPLGQTKNISSLGETFILYPVLSDAVVRWRAAIEVDRFYRTNRSDIRCRRYKGGKVLQLSHQGTNDYLKDSWNILQDSLVNKIQAYPAIQAISKENDSIVNPLNWTTQLYMPIQ